MRGYNKIIRCLLALSMLVGCVKENSNKMDGVTIKLNGFDLDDAKAMAHLKTDGAVTKAPVEFQQSEALYLVYGDNEIRLPEIKFSVEVPDSMSNWEKNQLLKDIHITVAEPFIKDCGNYIFVRTSLGYYTTFNDSLHASPYMGARAFYLIRKEDGQLCEITDWSNGMASLLLYQDMVVDSAGNYYLVNLPGSHATSVHRLFETQDGFEVRTADVGWVQIDFSSSIIDGGLADLTYIADQFQLTQTGPVVIGKDDKLYTYSAARGLNDTGEYFEGIIQLGIVSPDLTCEKVRIDGSLLGFHKSGNDLMLFVIDRSTFKLYNATDGCKLLSSVTVDNYDERYMDWGFKSSGNIDGIYTFCEADVFVRFDVNKGECTTQIFGEAIREYLHAGYQFIGGNFYLAYSPWESGYVDVLKIDVLTEKVEQLRRLEIPEGCFFAGGIWVEDEAKGRLCLNGTFVNQTSNLIVEEVNVEIYDPEIAEAYAKANAVEDYGIDFGSYTVVNVVPLDDELVSSQN